MHISVPILGSVLLQLLSIFLSVLFLSSFEASTALASPAYAKLFIKTRLLARDESDYPSYKDIANDCGVDADKSVFFSQSGTCLKGKVKIIFRGAFPPNTP